MYSTSKIQIVEFIKQNGQAQPKELVRLLGVTQAAVHRALKKLVSDQTLVKKGTPPKVFYFLKKAGSEKALTALTDVQKKFLQDYYIYINPEGKIESGFEGFVTWMKNTLNKQNPEKTISDYIEVVKESESFKNNKYCLIDATDRFKKVFPMSYLDKIFYSDFYNLVRFGKTKMGQLLLNGKQSQNRPIIQRIAEMVAPDIRRIIQLEKIDAVAWAPHSIPRKIPFLKELEKALKLELPKIEILKAYSGDFPIAQKSLTRLEERIQNARETMVVVPQKITAKKILLIDDAVGSGATLNEISQKLKSKGAGRVIGYAIVGSYKGFEVIKEV
jgi:hypothetical protein